METRVLYPAPLLGGPPDGVDLENSTLKRTPLTTVIVPWGSARLISMLQNAGDRGPSPLISSRRHFSARTPSISTTATLTPKSVRSRFVLSLVLPILSWASKVAEGALKENKWPNHDRFGEDEDVVDAELEPISDGEYGTGSIVTTR